jgi:hypothetical protein
VPKATRRVPHWDAHDEIGPRIATYRPRNIESSSWFAVQPFVLDCAERLPLSGWPSTIRGLRALAQLAAWAAGEGLSLDREVILDPDTVERFTELGLSDDRSRATYRAILRRVGPLLTVRAPWEPRPASVARRQVAPLIRRPRWGSFESMHCGSRPNLANAPLEHSWHWVWGLDSMAGG